MAKRAAIEFTECSTPGNLELRFGGEPFGLPAERWPRSKTAGEAMQFICQIPFGPGLFPGTIDSMAYLFMNNSEAADETWRADGGENALILLPREQTTRQIAAGKALRLSRRQKPGWRDRLWPRPDAFSAKLTFREDPDFIAETELFELPDAEAEAYRDALAGNKLGGAPAFLQGDELPFPEPWHLLLQLDSTDVPFEINFGDAGIGYAFINFNGTEGKFLWQCC